MSSYQLIFGGNWQAARNKAQNPTAKVFVYRNIVKALPWYTEVRELLQDQVSHPHLILT